ncbi:MAG: flagellar basal body L-ring protein FlgH [Thermodesulfobacteriota bacterium]
MRFSGKLNLWVLLALVLVLAGCAPNKSFKDPLTLEPMIAPPLPPAPAPQEGSIWNGQDTMGLLADTRATNVGDTVTVAITENSKASEIADTDTSKTSGAKVTIGSLFGLNYPLNPFSGSKDVNVENQVDVGAGLTTKGNAKTERQNIVVSYLTAQVIQVLPNRNLVIQGRRHIKINNETEIMTLTGIVRPRDISRDNIVPSNRIAEARLVMTGVGVVSDKQRVGWVQRIFDHIWPF